ncbi:MAG: sigma-70 family RNA polymerase sigma factor [Candidatus Eremiobacteraeota bacterium]|nr:sigma-70 family RNA polymerase sigma factor [Candidatus Eremiobacteraeota bacterium]
MISNFPSERDNVVLDYGYLCSRGARKFWRTGLERADLQQVAAIGLIKAYDRFEPLTGTPFEAYAWLFVVGELMHYVRDYERLIRPPRRLRSLERRWLQVCEDLTSELGREPQRAEIAGRLGVAEGEVDALRRYRESAVPQSLDDIACGRDAEQAYTIEDRDDALAVAEALRRLPEPERTIVSAIHLRGFSRSEISHCLGYTPRHISRMHRDALRMMQPMLSATR